MPVLVKAGKDEDRLATLSQTQTSHKVDFEKGSPLVSDETAAEIETVVTPFREAMGSVDTLKSHRSREIAEKNIALASVNLYVRHFWSSLKNRVIRENLPVSLLTLYGLPQSGLLPTTAATPAIIETARKLIAADAEAVTAGNTPMSNPSAIDLERVVVEAQKELNDTATVDDTLNSKEDELAQLRNRADILIDDVVAELKFNLRRLPEPDQRRIMRGYGLVFKGTKGQIAQ